MDLFESIKSTLIIYRREKQVAKISEVDEFLESVLFVAISRLMEIPQVRVNVLQIANQIMNDAIASCRPTVTKERDNYPPKVRELLLNFVDTRKSVYPSKEEVQDLCQRTGLDNSQVRNWFANYRKRSLS